MTHFERLDLPPRFALDPAAVENAYLARSRALHPDFHQQGASSHQRASMELTAALNEAYATLKHPFRRAEYLLALLGGPTASVHKEMTPAFLEEMLELRMEIEELRADANPESPGRQRMARQLAERSDRLVKELASCFATIETMDAANANRQGTLVRIRQTLNAAKYIEGLLRDLRAD
jgi:molecular chaperone HscB